MNKKTLLMLALSVATLSGAASNHDSETKNEDTLSVALKGNFRYCNTYEQFVNKDWKKLDTLYCEGHSKSHQLWVGGNDFKFTTGDKNTDKALKKDAFIVMVNDTMYINCRNLRFEKTSFGSGYTKAKNVGAHSLLFVNTMIGKEAQSKQAMSGFMFGAIGGAISASQQMKQQVCYRVSSGADAKGNVNIRFVNDELVEKMLAKHEGLLKVYYSERKKTKRQLATHVLPLLEKAGIFEPKNEANKPAWE